VAKGFKERYGKEFWETFSSNVKLEDVRLMIAVATYYDLDLWHFDIKAYFLYGIMDEVVHMSQPEGYHEGPPPGSHDEMVCLLKKAIYGTKQAQRCADKELKKGLKELGIESINSDDSLYLAREGNKIFLCAMYVDDGLCFGNNNDFVNEKLDGLGKLFDIIVVKDPKVFLGLEIERDRIKGITLLHQESSVINETHRSDRDC
jgi:hypothetical protein